MNDWMAPLLFRILVVAIIFSPTVRCDLTTWFYTAETGSVYDSAVVITFKRIFPKEILYKRNIKGYKDSTIGENPYPIA